MVLSTGRSCLIPVSIYYRRPIEERVVHALGKAWHVEVTVATRWNIRKHFGTFYNYMFILEVLYSSDRELYWILSVVKKKSKILVFHDRENSLNSSILSVPNVNGHFLELVTTRRKGWPIVRLITIRFVSKINCVWGKFAWWEKLRTIF